MNVLNLLRIFFFALFMAFNGIICAITAWNLSLPTRTASLGSLDAFLIFVSLGGFLFAISILIVDAFRQGAITSKVWFELVWLALFWVLNLSAASASTAQLPALSCTPIDSALCQSVQALTVFTWLNTGLLLSELFLLLLASIYYSKHHPQVWVSSVTDFQWFHGGGPGSKSLDSATSTPDFKTKVLTLQKGFPSQRDVERGSTVMVTHLVQPSFVAAPVPRHPMRTSQMLDTEPKPLTLEYAPELPPARAPMHYTASSKTAIGGLPRRKSKDATATASLYPAHMQFVVKPAPSEPARSSTSTGGNLPIRNWPRRNPQEPLRRERPQPSHTATGSSSSLSSTTSSSSSGSSNAGQAPSARRPAGPRPKHRPPPLDFSKISSKR